MRTLRLVLMAFAAMLMVPITFGSTSAVSADITIIGDDDQDAFVGTGSLLLPPQLPLSPPAPAATLMPSTA